MKKRFWVIGLALTALLLVPAACASIPLPLGSSSSQPTPAPAPGYGAGTAGIPKDTGTYDEAGTISGVSAERMIVRNGNLSLKVADVAAARDQITQLASILGGFVVASSLYSSGDSLAGNISIRVPDEKFDGALAGIRALAAKVDQENTSSQDITQEYIDLESRLKNAQATESQYLNLLSKATTVTDILSIQDKLSQTRQQIEQLKGRMQYLEQTSALSLITVSLQTEEGSNPVTWLSWNFTGILKAAAGGLIIFLQILLAVVIWVIVFSPVWGAIIGTIYWLRRRRKS